MRTRTRRGFAVTALAAAAAITVAACGSSGSSADNSKSPQDAVRSAYSKLLDSDAVSMTFKADTTADQLVQLGKSSSDGDGPTAEQAKAIAGGSIVVAVKSGSGSLSDAAKKGSNGKESFAFTVNAGDAPKLVEIRYIDSALYARADVHKFLDYAGQDASVLNKLTGPDAPQQLSFLKDAVAGKWLKLPLNEVLSAFGGKQSSPSVDPSQAAALTGALDNIFNKDVTAAKADGSSDLGDHYVLSGNSRQLVTDLVNAFKSQLSSLPGADQAFNDFDPADVPNKVVKLDAYVKGGKLNAVKLDVTQFLDPQDAQRFDGKPFYLEADFDDSADISTPSGATDVDLGSIIGGITGLEGSSNSF